MHGIHAPGLYRFGEALDRARPEIGERKSVADQPPGRRRDDHFMSCGKSLQARRQVRCFTHGKVGLGMAFTRRLAHDHRAGGQADAHGQWLHGGNVLHRLDHFQSGVHTALGVVFMCQRPAEIDHQPVAQVLGDVSFVPRGHVTAGLAVGLHQLAQFLGVHPFGQGCRSHKVAEHHGELAALGPT